MECKKKPFLVIGGPHIPSSEKRFFCMFEVRWGNDPHAAPSIEKRGHPSRSRIFWDALFDIGDMFVIANDDRRYTFTPDFREA
ncbi:hypothetical protein C172_26813 [Paenibacillus sp. FSL H8-457]|nr:hypothetical protein C172_26813 [Paenibacillus sp. FSL H8-457]